MHVRIEHLDADHDQALAAEVINPHNDQVERVVHIAPGQAVEEYVHPDQHLHIREELE